MSYAILPSEPQDFIEDNEFYLNKQSKELTSGCFYSLRKRIRTMISKKEEKKKNLLEWHPLFIKIFDTLERLQKHPLITLQENDLELELAPNSRKHLYFKKEHYSHSIVRASVTFKDKSEMNFILFRFKDYNTDQIYRESIGFYTENKMNWMKRFCRLEQQKILFSPKEIVQVEDIDRLSRLIRGAPLDYDQPYWRIRSTINRLITHEKRILELI